MTKANEQKVDLLRRKPEKSGAKRRHHPFWSTVPAGVAEPQKKGKPVKNSLKMRGRRANTQVAIKGRPGTVNIRPEQGERGKTKSHHAQRKSNETDRRQLHERENVRKGGYIQKPSP